MRKPKKSTADVRLQFIRNISNSSSWEKHFKCARFASLNHFCKTICVKLLKTLILKRFNSHFTKLGG